MKKPFKSKERVSESTKNASGKKWYKERIDSLENTRVIPSGVKEGTVSEKMRMQVNYDLFNNILNIRDFEYVCAPYGAKVGELPATMSNKDISSGPIKTMLGMEMKRPLPWSILATNPEATTAREEKEFGMFKEHVINEALKPLRIQIEKEKASQNGEELTADQTKAIEQEVEQELQTRTPEHIKRYMAREYQDPAEVMSSHLIKYLIQKCETKRKFNDLYKHGLISGKEIGYVGIFNGEPQVVVVDPMRFSYDKSKNSSFIEDSEWCIYRDRLKPSQIVSMFRDELSPTDIDNIYASWTANYNSPAEDDLFAIYEADKDWEVNSAIEVIHCQFKSLRKMGFLTYYDEDIDGEATILVDEDYVFDETLGDISLTFEWIPETYEGWKIKCAEPIYIKMRPVPGQTKDIDNLQECKLSYYGIAYDDMNSQSTSLMDRLVVYQYYYNIVMYRLELLIASDKGKKILMNIGSIPTSAGFDLEKWQYFFESSPFAYFDPSEEGSTYQDANNVAKVLDLSLASDINKYMEIAESIRQQAGKSVGITDQVLGQIGPREAVGNTQQALIQSSHILEMYFELHNHVKKNILKALLETAKVAYAESKPRKLSYFLDDMSVQLFDLDIGLLDSSTLGLFFEDSMKAEEAQEFIRQMAHAALQNQKIELSDVIAILRENSIVDSEEILKVAEQRRVQQEQQSQQADIEARAEEAEKERDFEREKWQHEKDLAIIKEEERRKTIISGNAITGMSFNPDVDTDGDGVNDFLEIAKHGLDAEVKREEINLKREALQHQKETDKKRLENENKKLDNEKLKIKAAAQKTKTT